MKKLISFVAVFSLVFSPVTPGHAIESAFSGADGEWTTPGSWSNGVPGAGDDAVINAKVAAIGGAAGSASVLSAVFNNNAIWASGSNALTLVIGGGTGMATFNGSSYNNNSGTINGNATFNGSSYNRGTVNGNAILNTTYYNGAAPEGNELVIATTKLWRGEVKGTVYNNLSSANLIGSVNGF